MTKKIIIAIVLIAIIIGFLFFYKNQAGDSGFDIVKEALPFGEGASEVPGFIPTPPDGGEKGGLVGEDGAPILPKLFQIHQTAIAGAYSFEYQIGEGGGETLVRYLERGVGHIFETNLSTTKERRISNTTRLKIHEAVWGDNGKSVIIRYLDDEKEETIRSFLIKLADIKPVEEIPGEVADQVPEPETEGVFLPENIKNIAVSNDSKKIFYLLDTGSTGLGTIYNLETGKAAQIFRSALTEWLPQWPNKDTVTLTTKPSGDVPGVMYFLDTNTENMTKILGGINGLTTLTSPDGNNVLYSESSHGVFTLNLYNTKERSTQTLPLTTLPEKCVWSTVDITIVYCAVPTIITAEVYPDRWYQGVVSFSDEIWMIDTETYTTDLIVNPNDTAREEMDAINLSLDPSEKFLFFTNKKDLSLWGVRIRQ